MSEQNHYQKLGVKQDATFDEIQEARNRLVQEHHGDSEQLEQVEAAYDAILMERLRMRQEGKIKVPEGIKFAERLTQAPPKQIVTPIKQSAPWLQRLIDSPSLTDVLLPGSLFIGLGSLSIFYSTAGAQLLQITLIIGVGLSLYFLTRKEQNFGRAVLLTGVGLAVGLIFGGLVANLLQAQLTQINLGAEQFSAAVTFCLLWIISSFLR